MFKKTISSPLIRKMFSYYYSCNPEYYRCMKILNNNPDNVFSTQEMGSDLIHFLL